MPFTLFIVTVPVKVVVKDDSAPKDGAKTGDSDPVSHIGTKVRDYIVNTPVCQWISEELFLNGKAWWASFMFTVKDGSSEACVKDLCNLGVGASIAATKGDEPKGKGTILVIPARILRVGSEPKVFGNPAYLTNGDALEYPPPNSPKSSPKRIKKSITPPHDAPDSTETPGSPETHATVEYDYVDDEDDAEIEEEDIKGEVSVTVQEGKDGGKSWRKYTASFEETIQSRISVDSVIQYVFASSEFSFDYVSLIINASIIACVGLVTNNTVIIVASMLVSPLMGPIMAVTFGAVVDQRNLVKRGLFSEGMGLVMCILVGLIGGLCAAPFCGHSWPTQEMASRGVVSALWTGVAIAIPSGFGAALSITGNNTSSLVGVAISASLLPPAVNCGVLLASKMLQYTSYVNEEAEVEVNGDTQSFSDLSPLISFCVTLINIVLIYLCSYVMFLIKGLGSTSDFWTTHVKNARKYHQALRDPEKREHYLHAFQHAKNEKPASVHAAPMEKTKASWKWDPFKEASVGGSITSSESQAPPDSA